MQRPAAHARACVGLTWPLFVLPRHRFSTSKKKTAEERLKYKKLYKEAAPQVWKLSPRGLKEAFGQREDPQAPPLKIPGGGSVPAVLPPKGSHLLFDAAVWNYYTSYSSANLTGCGTRHSQDKANRSGTAADKRKHADALENTLKAFGECTRRGERVEILSERALEVRGTGARFLPIHFIDIYPPSLS